MLRSGGRPIDARAAADIFRAAGARDGDVFKKGINHPRSQLRTRLGVDPWRSRQAGDIEARLVKYRALMDECVESRPSLVSA